MLLAAGRGTRLRPLTDRVPKILVPVAGVPMLERLLAGLQGAGIREVALNTHHLAGAVERHLAGIGPRVPQSTVRTFHEPKLLGTGGALGNIREFWGDRDLLLWNGDILADLDIAALAAAHRSAGSSGAVATLVTQQRAEAGHLLLDEAGLLCGIDSPRRGGRRMVREIAGNPRAAAYCGIALLAPALQDSLQRPGAFDLIDVLLEIAANGTRVATFDLEARLWGTSGSPEELATLETALAAAPEVLVRWTPTG